MKVYAVTYSLCMRHYWPREQHTMMVRAQSASNAQNNARRTLRGLLSQVARETLYIETVREVDA